MAWARPWVARMTNQFNDDDNDDDNFFVGTFSTDCPFACVSRTGDATEVGPSAEVWLLAGWG